jgi:hypothetical protein
MRAPDPVLPPWSASCKREREALIKWTLDQLDMQDWELIALEPGDDWMLNFPPPGKSSPTRLERLERAKQLARAGNAAPLQSLLVRYFDDPELAEFIQSPKRKRGQRRSYHDPNVLVAQRFARLGVRGVVADVKRIRALWRQHYGRWKRRGQVSAEEIAGLRHGKSEDQVRAAIKALSR